MIKQSVRRRRAIVAMLVVMSLALLTVHFGETENGAVNTAQRGVMAALSPLQDGASQVLKPVSDSVNWFGEMNDAQAENRKLRRDLTRAQKDLAETQAAERENSELRKLVRLQGTPSLANSHNFVTARVIGRNTLGANETVRINAGSSAGVRPQAPVVADGALVGLVEAVAPNASQVRLITDQRSEVSVRIMPSGRPGLLRPSLDKPGQLWVEDIQEGQRVRKGMRVQTAGWSSRELESIYPGGISVGKVKRVETEDLVVYGRVRVEPGARLDEFGVVSVLVAKQKDMGR